MIRFVMPPQADHPLLALLLLLSIRRRMNAQSPKVRRHVAKNSVLNNASDQERVGSRFSLLERSKHFKVLSYCLKSLKKKIFGWNSQ